MTETPISPPPPAAKKSLVGWAILWFAVGFVTCGAFVVGGSFLFYYWRVKPTVEQAMKSIATTPPPMPHKAPKAVFEGNWTRADGGKLDFATLRGKVVVLNVWATWCGPCMAELPSLAKLAAHYRTAGDVCVVCVSNEAPAEIWPKMNQHEAAALLYTCYRRQLPSLYDTRAIPATFIISKRGDVVFQHAGAANWDSADTLRYIDELRQQTVESGR